MDSSERKSPCRHTHTHHHTRTRHHTRTHTRNHHTHRNTQHKRQHNRQPPNSNEQPIVVPHHAPAPLKVRVQLCDSVVQLCNSVVQLCNSMVKRGGAMRDAPAPSHTAPLCAAGRERRPRALLVRAASSPALPLRRAQWGRAVRGGAVHVCNAGRRA
jgi:hypothetical protein